MAYVLSNFLLFCRISRATVFQNKSRQMILKRQFCCWISSMSFQSYVLSSDLIERKQVLCIKKCQISQNGYSLHKGSLYLKEQVFRLSRLQFFPSRVSVIRKRVLLYNTASSTLRIKTAFSDSLQIFTLHYYENCFHT